MAKQLQIGVIGGGQIAQAHMKNFSGDPRSTVRWLAEINPEAREKSVAAFKIPHATGDYREMLKDPELDAVVICTPPVSHSEIGIAVLRAGKHLLVEKPLTVRMDDARKLLAEVKKHPKLKVSGCSCRHARLNPKFAFVKQLIDDGKIGRPYLVHHRALGRQGRGGVEYNPNAKWFLDRVKAGGGPLYDWGVYDLSFHLGVLGQPKLEKVEAFCVNGLDRVAHGAPVFSVEEHGGAFMRFKGGINYWWERSTNSHVEQPNQTVILGTKGGLRFGYCSWDSADFEYFDVENDGTGKARKQILKCDMQGHNDDMHPLGKGFISFVLGEGPCPMPLDIELENLAVMHAVYDAADWGKEDRGSVPAKKAKPAAKAKSAKKKAAGARR
jgi:predicted dehydrogenase